ncbi:DUF305 domain-containing protein [Brasilonema octagenarum UFV-E1]|uniref:DUF305 domain-containing protein n=1 Tax=Brasilonema sennae CENA114 TaxID=415709 RepID=A0A856MET6_9CYAN|nr:DUF305 domain-containing protein [Brasilonema sennae]QDL09845.1 DUF305 domain-containing protein [Brasilonema sennae CENA114]QDL16198.1 DUF305 domain-containing protein [Brasilonema octagenarum UFV-E1]
MQRVSWKTGFFTVTFIALASLSACSTTTSQNQTQAPNTTATEASDKQQMNHGGMNHSSDMNHSMDLGSADANYDLRFIDAMTPHHEGAVVMAKVALQKSKRPEIKKLAQEIIKAQNKEIAELKQWRTAWYPKAPSTPMAWNTQMNHMMEMSPEQSKAMRMDMDLGAADNDFDLRFINAMIPHHEAAVTMAQDALNKSKRPEIKKLAQNIITSQQQEIAQMKKWRQAWYKQ